MLALAVKQGAALAAFGVAAGCGGKAHRADDGLGDDSRPSTGGFGALGGSTNTGGNSGPPGGSSPDGGTHSTGGATNVAGSMPAAGNGPSGGGGTSGGSAGSETGGQNGGAPGLTPYPLEEVGCMGPLYENGYVGQCCISPRCYTPDAGACSAADQRPPIPIPPGSGTCGCSPDNVTRPTLKGPYAPNPEGVASPEGSCCYLVGSIGCEGRPLVVAGTAVVAPLALRGDWCATFA